MQSLMGLYLSSADNRTSEGLSTSKVSLLFGPVPMPHDDVGIRKIPRSHQETRVMDRDLPGG